jgi:hypothetical protein
MDQITRIENKLDRAEEKIDFIAEDQHEMKITLISQHATLQEHMRRTELNEQAISLIKEQVDPLVADKLMLSGALKFVGIMIGLAGAADVILRFFHR